MSKPKTISATQAAKIAGVTPETIRNLCKAGTISYTKRGNLFYPDREDIEKYRDTIQEIHKATASIEELRLEIQENKEEIWQKACEQRMHLADIGMFQKRIEAIAQTLAAALERYNQDEICYKGQISAYGIEFMIRSLQGTSIDQMRGPSGDIVSRERARQIWYKALRVYAFSKNENQRLQEENQELRRVLQEKTNEIAELNAKLEGKEAKAYDEAMMMSRLLATRIKDYDLTIRVINCADAAEIRTLRDLVRYRRADMLKFRNFGKKSLTELDELLDKLGLHFGMPVDIYPEYIEEGGEQ